MPYRKDGSMEGYYYVKTATGSKVHLITKDNFDRRPFPFPKSLCGGQATRDPGWVRVDEIPEGCTLCPTCERRKLPIFS